MRAFRGQEKEIVQQRATRAGSHSRGWQGFAMAGEKGKTLTTIRAVVEERRAAGHQVQRRVVKLENPDVTKKTKRR